MLIVLRRLSATVAAGGLALVLTTAQGSAQQPASTHAPIPGVLQSYNPVTAERLLRPEDGSWLMVRRTYDGWGYSPLDQITPNNIARLQPDCQRGVPGDDG